MLFVHVLPRPFFLFQFFLSCAYSVYPHRNFSYFLLFLDSVFLPYPSFKVGKRRRKPSCIYLSFGLSMEDSLGKNNGLSDSGEVPVDFEVEIQGENGNLTQKETNVVHSINVEGSVSGNLPGHSATNVEKPVEKLEPGTSQRAKAGRHNQNQNRTLGLLAAKLFDDKIPLRKKLKLFNRLATVQDDGTVKFEVPEDIKPGKLDFGTGVVYNGASGEATNDIVDNPELPPLQIVMLIVGTRGDVQPFVAIGKKLQENGHRVRLATHANFKEFVLGAGLEFYPLGGDPKALARLCTVRWRNQGALQMAFDFWNVVSCSYHEHFGKTYK